MQSFRKVSRKKSFFGGRTTKGRTTTEKNYFFEARKVKFRQGLSGWTTKKRTFILFCGFPRRNCIIWLQYNLGRVVRRTHCDATASKRKDMFVPVRINCRSYFCSSY